jgi:hypothetical protein
MIGLVSERTTNVCLSKCYFSFFCSHLRAVGNSVSKSAGRTPQKSSNNAPALRSSI